MKRSWATSAVSSLQRVLMPLIWRRGLIASKPSGKPISKISLRQGQTRPFPMSD